MAKSLAETVKNLIPEALKHICTWEDLEVCLQGDNPRNSYYQTRICVEDEKDGSKTIKEANFSDAMTLFKKEFADPDPLRGFTAAIMFISTYRPINFEAVLEAQNHLAEMIGFLPLVIMAYTKEEKIELDLIGAQYEQDEPKRGRRLAFDLDDTITRWPDYFKSLSQQNAAEGGFNMILSTRHEPKESSAHDAVFQRELEEIESIGMVHDKLCHAWWDFKTSKQLHPCEDDTQWFRRLVWQKAFLCRLNRIEVYFEDQKRNISLFKKYAPDIEVIHVSQNAQPDFRLHTT